MTNNKMLKNILKKELSVFFVFIIVAVAFFNKGIFLHTIKFFDASYIYPRTPIFSIKWDYFLWNPYILCGNPLLADGNNYHILSPFTIIVLFLQDFFRIQNFISFNIVYILHFPLAGFFIYLYARCIGMGRAGALISGIIYSLSNFFFADSAGIHKMDSMVWVGLILFFIEKALVTRKVNYYYIILAGIFFGFQFLSASNQYSYYFSIFLIFYLIFRYFITLSETGYKKEVTVSFILIFFLIFIIGIGIFAIQLLPTYELAKESARFYLKDYRTAYGYYYLDSSFLKGILSLNREDAENSDVFIGIVPIILALIVFMSKKRNKYHYFYLFTILFFLILSSRNFLSAFLYDSLPFFSFFKKSLRSFFIFILSVAVLAGFGLEKIRSNLVKVSLIALILFQIYPVWKLKYNDSFLSKVEEFNKNLRKYSGINKVLTTYNPSNSTFRIFLHPDYINWGKYRFYSSFGRSDFILSRYLEFSKGSTYDIDKLKDEPYYNFLLYPNYIKLTNSKYIVLVKESADESDDKVAIEEKEIAGYFQDNPLFEKIYEDSIVVGYLFKDPLPRSLFVTYVLYLKDRQSILDLLKQPSFDPKTTLILEEPVDKFNLSGQYSAGGGEARITKYLPSNVEIGLKASSSGFLVLLDTYYPGWKAYINDKPAKIYRADYLFRAVYIDKPGSYAIKLIYSPFFFKLGATITLITLIGCIGGMIWIRKRTH